LVCNSDSSTAGAKDDDAGVAELLVAGMQRCQEGGKCHAACALNVVIEASNLRAVELQKTPGCSYKRPLAFAAELKPGNISTVFRAKVLKVNVGSRKQLPSSFDECLDKVIVALSANSRLAQTEIEIIVEQILVVCAAV
jgi:hypothetical protein